MLTGFTDQVPSSGDTATLLDEDGRAEDAEDEDAEDADEAGWQLAIRASIAQASRMLWRRAPFNFAISAANLNVLVAAG